MYRIHEINECWSHSTFASAHTDGEPVVIETTYGSTAALSMSRHMTPEQARQVARHLMDAADEAERLSGAAGETEAA